jgi:hypothetical protein
MDKTYILTAYEYQYRFFNNHFNHNTRYRYAPAR